MEFSNGAVISGFVSGVGEKADGSGGGTIRGQSADIVYIDEMDMVPNKILVEAILPILASRKGTMLFASTTPIGKRGQFYNWCKNDPTFKEDHLPSTVLPQWEENKDLLIGDSNKEAILSEYMAEFIEGSFGVFRPSWVYGSAYEYEYEKTIMGNYLREKLKVLRPENMLKCIGIDWNKNAGTEFCVVGFDPDSGRWIVLETVNIAASEFSSIKWKEEVIRLNYKWKPNYIYADEGYGHTIIEDLKILSHKVRQSDKPTPQHVETAKIVDRLVSFNFSSRVELRNPIDSTVIVKTGKEFLVENTIRIFEDSNIIFSNEDTTLRLQLLNYVVKRRNPQNNKPIYGPDNEKIADHRLDAFMLALGGLYLQESEYAMDNGLSTKPGLLSRELLKKRADKKEVSFVPEIFGQLKENSPIVGNTTLSFLEIVRQGGAGSPSATPEKQPRVTRRSEGMASGHEESVYEHFKSLGSTKGYGTDEEHLNQKHGGPSIIPGRRGPQSGRPKFNRGR